MQFQLRLVFYASRMIRDEYPDDCVTQAVLEGRPPVVLGALAVDPIAFEEEEPESPDAAIGYGSLLSLGSSMRKKKPLIVVDPVEAENEARRVQFVAAQQLVDPDGAEGIDFLEGLAHFAERVVVDAEEEGVLPGEPVDALVEDGEPDGDKDDHAAIACSAEPDGYADSDADPFAADEAQADSEVPVDWVEPLAETPDREMAISVEALARIYQARDIAPIAPIDEPEEALCEPVPAQLEIRPHGHSLRARMPSRPPRKTLAAHVVTFVGWLYDRLTRRRS